MKTKRQLTIALDAMGGDLGPDMVIPGAELAVIRHPDARFLLFGDRSRIAPLLERHGKLKDRAEIRHTDVAIAMDAKPSQALRQGRGKSSMWLAIDAVRLGEADVAVSAGNTGAL
ncbi:MAG: phosphate acyltransferase, partial [Alphaproteobacteria bacterium]|nr:phosphate acyltransferase [Alphaproteobacteria bacterium]